MVFIEQVNTVFHEHFHDGGVGNMGVVPHILFHASGRVVLIYGHFVRQIKMLGNILLMGDRHGINGLVILKPNLFPGYRVEVQQSLGH